MNLRIAKNTGSGATWHILKGDTSICGSISDRQLQDNREFQGLEDKPAHGTWCGVCKRIYKSESFEAQRTSGPIHP
jgi:hypothetical protein